MTSRTFRALVIGMMTIPMIWIGIALAQWLTGAALVVVLTLYSVAALALVGYGVWLAHGERHDRVHQRAHGIAR